MEYIIIEYESFMGSMHGNSISLHFVFFSFWFDYFRMVLTWSLFYMSKYKPFLVSLSPFESRKVIHA
jgi:hypothetical protein